MEDKKEREREKIYKERKGEREKIYEEKQIGEEYLKKIMDCGIMVLVPPNWVLYIGSLIFINKKHTYMRFVNSIV